MKCEFWKECPYFKEDSATCTKDAGGNYCGKFRELSEKNKVKA